MTNQNILQRAAINYSVAGFATLPVDKAKRPTVGAWAHYQKNKPNKIEICRWFNGSKPETTGLALLAGKVSGNIEVLDIDCKYDLTGSLMEDFTEIVKEHLPELFQKLVIAKTVNKGFHILVRVPTESIQGNKKLASRPATAEEIPAGDKVKVLIETRGEAGYFVVAPTVGYEWVQGTFENIPTVTAEERNTLFTIARSFDQMPVKIQAEDKTENRTFVNELSPFDDYNGRAEVQSLLEKHGWRLIYQRGESLHYKRPGTTDSVTSANYHKGLRIFYVFSTSTEFESGRGFNPVQVYTQLEHSGDYSAASKALYAAGYGARRNGKAETETPGAFEETETKIKPFPVPNKKCFYGLAGDFVRLVEPHTEASLMALLAQFLVYFGNIVGRSAHFKVEGDRHYTNLYCVLVGKTAQGRKGTSFGRVKEVFKGLDAQHEKECLASGLASGEGLLYHVRDAVEVEKKDKDTGKIEKVVVDNGVSDKRLLIIESEFAQVLRVQGREGNTLSSYIRNLWDTGTTQSLTKNSPLRTTDALVSIIGHITQTELTHTLSEIDAANGYANRISFFSVERARFLPFGSEIPEVEIGKIRHRIKQAIEFAAKIEQMKFSDEARELWASNYQRLETSRYGYLAKVTQRASPYVLRFSCIFALLDRSWQIERVHLETALAVWQYSEDSARYIFGERLADQTAEKILTELKDKQESGLTRTEIRNLFDRHISNEKLDAALQTLLESGLADRTREDTKGRPKEIWFACVKSVKSVLSQKPKQSEESYNAFNAFNANETEYFD